MASITLSKKLFLIPVLFPIVALAVENVPRKNQAELMAEARKSDLVGSARKTKEVDARPASPGEIVITFIRGQGVEMRSRPAEKGDWVVRNRCEETGNEEILVKGRNFPDRYGEPLSQANAAGYSAFKPKGDEMSYFIVTDEIGPFNFRSSWDEPTVALPGDAIVQMSTDESDTYRVTEAAFQCTYEIINPAKVIVDAAMR